MRFNIKASVFMLLLLLSLTTQAQFNVNNLFAPIEFRVPVEIFRMVTEDNTHIYDSTVFDLPESIAEDHLHEWKNWSFVENYAFGKDRGALPMITDLNSLHPFFRDQIKTLIVKCKAKGIELAVVEAYRTHAKQHEYKTMGKKYTNSGAGRSKHQYGLAVDVVPIVDSVAVWNNVALWKKIGAVGEKLGLRWGGRWRKPYDPGHFEWTGGLTSSNLGSGKLPEIPAFDDYYPCLQEDIEKLKRYWREWETSQSAMTRR